MCGQLCPPHLHLPARLTCDLGIVLPDTLILSTRRSHASLRMSSSRANRTGLQHGIHMRLAPPKKLRFATASLLPSPPLPARFGGCHVRIRTVLPTNSPSPPNPTLIPTCPPADQHAWRATARLPPAAPQRAQERAVVGWRAAAPRGEAHQRHLWPPLEVVSHEDQGCSLRRSSSPDSLARQLSQAAGFGQRAYMRRHL